MEDSEILAERAVTEIAKAKKQCETEAYCTSSRAVLWNLIRTWVDHPEFDRGFNALQCSVLNELEFTLANDQLRQEGWMLITELAKRWHREGNETMKEALRIASFECAAEPPECASSLELLFSLANDPDTRWAVFAAYENFPWRLRSYAKKYSAGSVTDDDCDHWLTEQGLDQDEILMARTK